MKAWVKSLSSTQYRVLHNACNIGGFVLGVVALWWLENYYLWGGLFALQMVSCYLLSKWRYGCDTCEKKYCNEHL